jgi:predicted ArsR family transcriptional regulator
MMQTDLYLLLKQGKRLTAQEAATILGVSRTHASTRLAQLERTVDVVKSAYQQTIHGDRIFSVKYYFIAKNQL